MNWKKIKLKIKVKKNQIICLKMLLKILKQKIYFKIKIIHCLDKDKNKNKQIPIYKLQKINFKVCLHNLNKNNKKKILKLKMNKMLNKNLKKKVHFLNLIINKNKNNLILNLNNQKINLKNLLLYLDNLRINNKKIQICYLVNQKTNHNQTKQI